MSAAEHTAGQPPQAYCLFCRTGSEQKIARDLKLAYPDLVILAPVRRLPEKRDGQWRERDLTLLPGYVFVFADGELPFDIRHKTSHLYKILNYERGIRALTGSDADYAAWLFRNSGVIGISRVLQAGDQIQVIDGPLADSQGRIVRLDKHKRRAWVEFEFDGEKRLVSIGADCLDALPAEPAGPS